MRALDPPPSDGRLEEGQQETLGDAPRTHFHDQNYQFPLVSWKSKFTLQPRHGGTKPWSRDGQELVARR